MRAVEAETGLPADDYARLHQWSIDASEAFWRALWSFTGIVASTPGTVVVRGKEQMPGARWFPEARLNFAENLLRGTTGLAMVFRGEDRVAREVSHDELRAEVSQWIQAFRAAGVKPGDRVAAYMPNMPETIMAMLGAAAIGAVWSSCSPDFGVQGVIDRFGQIQPKVLIGVDGYFYNGKARDTLSKLTEIVARLDSLQRVIVVPYISDDPSIEAISIAQSHRDAVLAHPSTPLQFEQLPFNHPLYILYSSGTTGVPKCIVHGVGGTLLQHLKEHQLHCDIHAGDRVFYFTTCGWMMWNWLASALASEAVLMLYDGSPFYPDGNALFDYVERERVAIFGTSAKFLDAAAKAGIAPASSHDLSSIKTILSTGSPLAPEGFDYVYRSVKSDVCLSSISGGTDIISCFVGGNPNGPVWRGEIQCPALGMHVQVLDDAGQLLPPGEKGELACANSFPSMPIEFWNDDDGAKYRSAYFEKFPGVWCHGDYVESTEHGGFIIYGRSDAVLNPGGVRIGTAEIYRQAEKLDEVVESLVIGQQWDGDTRIVLFVRLRDGLVLDDALSAAIEEKIRSNTTPRHVPAKIIQVADIPRTKSGKIVELAVRKVVHGESVPNKEALANPEALSEFANRPELAT
jgi:acetoacetyl-CoA synthetase